MEQENLVTFFSPFAETGILKPQLASESVGGNMPHKAVQYCRPSQKASGFGYRVYLPRSFWITWNGHRDYTVQFDVGKHIVLDTELHYPNAAALWDEFFMDRHQPELCGQCPHGIAITEQAGMLQIETMWFARTRPGYGLQVRGTPNFRSTSDYDTLEGIIETDWWKGPLFNNFQFATTGKPVFFDHRIPILHVVPLPKEVYDRDRLKQFSVEQGEYAGYAEFVKTRYAAEEQGKAGFGHYTRIARKEEARRGQ